MEIPVVLVCIYEVLCADLLATVYVIVSIKLTIPREVLVLKCIIRNSEQMHRSVFAVICDHTRFTTTSMQDALCSFPLTYMDLWFSNGNVAAVTHIIYVHVHVHGSSSMLLYCKLISISYCSDHCCSTHAALFVVS